MERNNSIDFIKFFAILFVVAIHSNPFAYNTSVDNIINIFARFAVPFFFIVSGYFLGKKLQVVKNTNGYVKNSLFKNFKLYISWILVFFFYDLSVRMLEAISAGESLKNVIGLHLDGFFNLKILYYGTGGGSFHLWFLIALLWSILIVYVFVKVNKLSILLIASLLLSIVGVFGQSYSVIWEIPIDTRDTLFFGLFYTTLGTFFAFHQHKLIWSNKIWLCLMGVFSAMQVVEGIVLINYFDAPLGNYYLSTIPLCISLFAVALKSKGVSEKNILAKIGKDSVGIYVMHPIFLSSAIILVELLGIEFITDTFVWNILFTPAVLLISYICYMLIQKIKAKFIDYRLHKSKAFNIK